MKTQKEIENMKGEIQKKINEMQEGMVETRDIHTLQNLSDRKRQFMAQYNILLEILK